MNTDSQYSLIERLIGYIILGFVGTIGIVAVLVAPILIVFKIMETPMMNFVVIGATIAVLLTLGYLYNLFFKYIERRGQESYRKQYEKEQAEMASNWITRGVTTVESPYIPNEDVQNIVEEYAEYNEKRNHSTFDFQAVSEYLEEKDTETGENRHQILMDFMIEHELELGDTINYWW